MDVPSRWLPRGGCRSPSSLLPRSTLASAGIRFRLGGRCTGTSGATERLVDVRRGGRFRAAHPGGGLDGFVEGLRLALSRVRGPCTLAPLRAATEHFVRGTSRSRWCSRASRSICRSGRGCRGAPDRGSPRPARRRCDRLRPHAERARRRTKERARREVEGHRALYYSNTKDPRLWVPKLNGTGLTLNFAHPWAWPVMVLLLGAPIGLVLGLSR